MKNGMGALHGKVILVVDDELEIRKILKNAFLGRGASILESYCGKLALEMVRSRPVDVVISDIRMPEGDGIALLEEIKRINPFVPVVFMMTAFDDKAERVALAKGAAQVFHKPFSLTGILSAVEAAVAQPQ